MVRDRLGLALRLLHDLVEPLRCAGCAVHGVAICAGCRAVLTGGAAPVEVSLCPGVPVAAAAAYAGPSRRLIAAWKDGDRREVTPLLATALIEALACLAEITPQPSSPRLLVPVPSRRTAIRQRGRDVTLDLARTTSLMVTQAVSAAWWYRSALAVGPIRACGALVVTRRLKDQAGLDEARRRRNVAGAYGLMAGVERVLAGAQVVVMDDVITTGASAHEAVRVLTAAGAQVVGVAAVCATVRRLPVRDVPVWAPHLAASPATGATLPLEHPLSRNPRLH